MEVCRLELDFLKGMSAIVGLLMSFLCVWICAGHCGVVSEYLRGGVRGGVLDGTAGHIWGMICKIFLTYGRGSLIITVLILMIQSIRSIQSTQCVSALGNQRDTRARGFPGHMIQKGRNAYDHSGLSGPKAHL